MMPRSLSGKTVLITGAAKRIGRALAFALGNAGASVCITFRNSSDEAEQTCLELGQRGVRAFAVHCDLVEPASVRDAAQKAVNALGKLDILVNNAGAFASGLLEEISVEAWDGMFAANTRGPFLMAQACYPALKATEGRIINIGSLGGIEPWATHAHYCASKAAMHMLSKTMAKAWAPEISVNCIAPGMIVQGEVGAAYQQFADRTPMKRNGTSDDVAAAALFFAMGPHFITGQLLAVDGGLGL